MSSNNGHDNGQGNGLFARHQGNPVLTAGDWPSPIRSVFNPGAVLLPDGDTYLLCRAVDHEMRSQLWGARSVDGLDGWQVEPAPALTPEPERYPLEALGIEDPRVVRLPELGCYAVTYTAYSSHGPCVGLALTDDFCVFQRYGVILPPPNKNAVLLPRRVGGRWALLHRPMIQDSGDIWVSYSEDLRQWSDHRPVLCRRNDGSWDHQKIGSGPPPIETEAGWLLLYHCVGGSNGSLVYQVGVALLDRDDPSRCLRRGRGWVLEPDADYERSGDVKNIVFPCGVTVAEDGDTLRLYYGAGDSRVAVASGSISRLLDDLAMNGAA